MAAEGVHFSWPLNGGTISQNLGVIWEMSAEWSFGVFGGALMRRNSTMGEMHSKTVLSVAAMIVGLSLATPGAQAQTPLVDAHIHYSHDAWDMLPPAEALAQWALQR